MQRNLTAEAVSVFPDRWTRNPRAMQPRRLRNKLSWLSLWVTVQLKNGIVLSTAKVNVILPSVVTRVLEMLEKHLRK